MKCFGASVFLVSLSSAALGQNQPLRVVVARIRVGSPQTILVVFNQPVAPPGWSPSQVPKGVRIDPPVAGRYDWPDVATLRLTPDKPLASGTYSLTLDSTFTAWEGARLERAATFRLQNEPPRASVVLRHTISDLRDSLQLEFSHAAGIPGIASDRPPRGVTLTPATVGRWRWVDSLRLWFTPARPFVAGVQYAIVVDTTFRGLSDTRLGEKAEFRFPDPLWVWSRRLPASPGDPLILQFKSALAAGAHPESLLAIDPPVDGVVTLPDSMTLQFTPRTGFKPGVQYVVSLSNTLQAVNGARLVGSPYVDTFILWLQVVERPWLEPVRPTDPLTFRFNHRVQPLSGSGSRVPRGFRLTPHVPGHVEWPDSQTLRFVPDSSFTPGKQYLLTLGRDFETPDGLHLADSITMTIRPGMRFGSYLNSGVSRLEPIRIGVIPTISLTRDTMMPLRGFRVDPPVPGSLWWTRLGQVEFRPDSILQPGTEYRLSFDTMFRAPDGTPLLTPATLRIRTRGLGVLAGWPVDAFVTSKTRFRFVLSEPTDPEGWAESLRMAPQGYNRPDHSCGRLSQVRFRAERPRPLRRNDSLFADVLRDTLALNHAPPSLITVVPDRELPAGCGGTLTATGLVEWPYHPAWPFRTVGEFRLRFVRAIPDEPVPAELRYGVGVELIYTTPVSESELLRHIRVSPPVAARFVAGQSPYGQAATLWQLEGDFAPATRYQMSADSALRDALGQHLVQSFDFTFTTASAKPAVIYQSTHLTVPTRAIPSVDVTSINVGELRVCTARVPDSARPQLVGGGWWRWSGIDSTTSESTECGRLTVRASPRDSVHTTVEVPWKAGWKSRPTGLYAVRISSPQTPGDTRRPAMIVFHVTDLAVHARMDRDRATVLVANRSSGVPVPGAAVTAKACYGDVLATATTDDSGLAELSGMAAAEQHARFACEVANWRTLEVTTPDDYDAVNVPLRSADPRELVGPLPASVVMPDRLVYRRGDTIRLRAVVRRPSPDSIRWVVVGSDRDGLERRPVLDTLIPLTHAGTAELALVVGPRLGPEIYEAALLVRRTGRWRQLADAEFWVTADPPPRVYLALTPERRWGARGDSVRFSVEAWNRNGTPASGVVEATWTGGRLNPYTVVQVPPGFTTAEVSVPWGEDSPEATGGARMLTLDAAGKGSFTLRLPERAPWWPWRVAVRVTMRAGGAQEGRASVDVYPAAFNLALARFEGDDALSDAQDSVDVFALRLDGTPLSGVRIEGLLAGRKWSPDPQESDSLPTGGGATVPDTLDQCTATTTDRPARCALRRFVTGYASASFSAADSQGRVVEIERLVSYPRDYGWNLEGRPEQHALAVDRTRFVVGDTAVVRIRSEPPGGIAWLTVAFADRVESRVLHLSGGVDTVRLPIQSRHAPRMTLTATIWYPERDGDLVTHAATTDEIDLEVRDPAEAMKVAMQLPDRAEGASMRRISFTVDSGSTAGDPAEILVWAVDERLAMVDSQRLPDLPDALRPGFARRVNVSSLEDPAPAAFEPVDPGASMLPDAMDVDPDVLRYGPWSERSRPLDDLPGPQLLGVAHAGLDGTAILDARLPEAVGRYRVIAVALTGSRLGTAEGVITIVPRQ